MSNKITCSSEEETAKFAADIASQLKGGEVIQLIGDMGAGKTTFVKALVKALNSDDHVSSPTFTISNIYKGRFIIYHCDFYRLEGDKLIEQELADMISDENIVVMEWPENVDAVKDMKTMDIKIDVVDENTREFEVVQ